MENDLFVQILYIFSYLGTLLRLALEHLGFILDQIWSILVSLGSLREVTLEHLGLPSNPLGPPWRPLALKDALKDLTPPKPT